MKAPLTVYNTLTGRKEPFEPLSPGAVRMYVCGPTVYDEAHLGHARCYITWDVLYRFLRYLGYTVRYARNITDVDDKILNRAKEQNVPFRSISEHYTKLFHEDMATLNVLPPTDEPKATEYIDEMLEGIRTLVDNKTAYISADGSVYFRAGAKADYGKLSKKPLDDLKAGARVEVDPQKESPLDFALWKAIPADDPDGWDAPWARGRPGWHMECSAMNHRIFGDQIDIHTGGADLIFPHHENEIAQSEAWTGKIPFVKYWMHNGFVNVSGEKMSKSLGNFSTIRRVLERYDPNTLRYFLLTNHYRMPVDFSDEALGGAKNRMNKIHRAFRHGCDVLGLHPQVLAEFDVPGHSQAEDYRHLQAFEEQMGDDLNTPQALATLAEAITDLNTALAETAEDLPGIRRHFTEALALFVHLGFNPQRVFDEDRLPPDTVAALRTIYNELTGQWLEPGKDPETLLSEIIGMRQQAKATKNWTQADAIRKHLSDIGIRLMDSKDGTTWELAGVPAGSGADGH